MEIWAFLAAMGVPSAVTGLCFRLIEKRIQKTENENMKRREAQQKEADRKEQIREENQFLILQSVNAAIALGEATAKAVQRIPDAHCNGDMHEALNYATRVKHEQKEFLTKQGIQNMYDE